MVVRPEFILVIILAALSLLITIFGLLRIIFILFRKYGLSKKKVMDAEVNKEKTETAPSPGIDSISLDRIEKDWKRYIDLQVEKLREELTRLIHEKVRNLPAPGGIGTSVQTEGKGKSIESTPGNQTDYYKKEGEVEPDFHAGNAQTICLRIYNAAITNPEEEREFRRQYKPIRVDVVNAMQRKRDPDLEAEFKTDDRGDFFVVDLKNDDPGGRISFIVLPRFGLKISDSNYRAGGVGDVFKCPGYNPQNVYGISRVVSPAIFAREGHDHWNLISRGELELAQEDYGDG